MPNPYQIKRILAHLTDAGEKRMTAWEFDYVNSLADLPEDKELTERQNEVLNRISSKTGL